MLRFAHDHASPNGRAFRQAFEAECSAQALVFGAQGLGLGLGPFDLLHLVAHQAVFGVGGNEVLDVGGDVRQTLGRFGADVGGGIEHVGRAGLEGLHGR